MTINTTIGTIINQVFPNGTTPGGKIVMPPVYPPDLFGVAGLLLQRSGGYQHIIAAEDTSADHPLLSVVVTEKDRGSILKASAEWRDENTALLAPKRVLTVWNRLTRHFDEPVFIANPAKPIGWWRDAFELLAIADEASEGVGYFDENGGSTWISRLAHLELETDAPKLPRSRHQKHANSPCSVTSKLVNKDELCVQPKSRTPNVGCSLRNLSHNLSLLPPRGEMQVHWLLPPTDQRNEDQDALNLLLIPYPYQVEPDWFEAKKVADKHDGGWGWFEVNQNWLKQHRDRFVDFVDALIEEAGEHGNPVNGLVFPEFALDYDSYEALADHLRDNRKSVQILVAGASGNCAKQTGNFALSSHFFETADHKRVVGTVSRPKHHRWSLDENQIAGYKLNFPKTHSDQFKWWEKIDLRQREIHVNALRNSSVFSAMICEDLARSSPAHEPLRAVGPNLVFVLLMDGPQREWRWASRYSTGLAEDPGSSVLTITSRALISRWNDGKPTHDQCWNISIWKDEGGRVKEIACPPEAQATFITLRGKSQIERTVDGRESRTSFLWTKTTVEVPISLKAKHADLTKLFCG